MKRSIIFISLFAAAMSCTSPENKETTAENDTVLEEAIGDSPTPETSLKMLDSYIAIKNALVESNPEAAAQAAADLEKASESGSDIARLASSIAVNNDLSMQRDAFYQLSEAMYSALKAAGSLEKQVYWQYCPMARDNQGANWLSLEEEIRNPYFGDQMLTCGSVEEEL